MRNAQKRLKKRDQGNHRPFKKGEVTVIRRTKDRQNACTNFKPPVPGFNLIQIEERVNCSCKVK